MTILYLGNFNPFMSSTEKIIKEALEKLGHNVFCFDERSVNAPDILQSAKNYKADLFLFHKGIRWGFSLQQLHELLLRLTCKKAFWYFDPINNFPDREQFMQLIIPNVDIGFLTNGTWIKQNNYKNLRWLLQGTEVKKLGKKKKEYECDIAFAGSIYKGREVFFDNFKKKYGDKFKTFNNVFDRDFYDLCASAKIMISPRFPANDFFWSNRIYKTLGAGGFMLHPRCEGLKKEFTAGVHYEDYGDDEELFMKIDWYLEHEADRKKIAKAGYEKCIKDFSYTERVKKLIEEIEKL